MHDQLVPVADGHRRYQAMVAQMQAVGTLDHLARVQSHLQVGLPGRHGVKDGQRYSQNPRQAMQVPGGARVLLSHAFKNGALSAARGLRKNVGRTMNNIGWGPRRVAPNNRQHHVSDTGINTLPNHQILS